jgi:glycosyltransferase involved in cell wall biosynthesis
MLRVDLHLHSRFSDRPSEWILRKLGMPQSYSQPEALYQKLHAAGMSAKTITDHNRIDGCLEIAHYPDVFISEEITTYFPDGCKIHLLAWNISEVQHTEIQRLRPNIFELSEYLRSQSIPHAVTHALFALNQQLTVEHFEQLLLLFRCFESIDGNREPLAQEIANLCFASLTPQKIEELANRHHFAPTHADAHRKILTAGSDDHSGLNVAKSYTEAADAHSLPEFFQALADGSVAPKGAYGNPLELSSSIYTTVFNYAQDRLKSTAPLGSSLLRKMAERFLAGQNPTAFSLGEKIGHVTEAIRTGQAFDFVKPGETTLAREIGSFFTNPKVKTHLDEIIAAEPNASRRSFRMAAYLTNQLAYRLGQQFQARLQRGNALDAFQSLTGLLPVGSAILPYLVAYHQQSPERPLLRNVARQVLGQVPTSLQNSKRAWFTDTLEDVNGVARTIQTMTLSAQKAGAALTVVTSRPQISITNIPIKNFAPVGEFEIPEYELQKLSFPPLLDIIDYIQREGFTELIISTPGPVGLCALAAGKLLGLRMSGIYHTDFPQYARFLSDDAFMETMVWNYMQWFYSQFHLIYSNSDFYRQRWIERGIPAKKLKILPRGLDVDLFNIKYHTPEFWRNRGAKGPVLLYVGRISKEKELAFLADVIIALKNAGLQFTPAFVGEGPYRNELAALLPDAIFTGILKGTDLARAYASADLFVFPSTTDTFGNVVIEAMAAGLPVAVSDVGGPKELIKSPRHGRVLPARQIDAWINGLKEMLGQLPTRAEREQLSLEIREERSWDRAFKEFWACSEE